MRPVKVLELLSSRSDYTILLDRRRSQLQFVEGEAALRLIDSWSVEGRDGATVWFGLFAGQDLPTRFAAGGTAYVRLMDRFFLPEIPGEAISEVLFDAIAPGYDALAHLEINEAVATLLLKSVCDPRVKATILDFGCGTGIVSEAAARLTSTGYDINVIGTDVSREMVQTALLRGQVAVPMAEWVSLPAESFTGAVANFVLHYGVSVHQLTTLANQLIPGGRFAANYFKPKSGALEASLVDLSTAGMIPESPQPIDFGPSQNFLVRATKRP